VIEGDAGGLNCAGFYQEMMRADPDLARMFPPGTSFVVKEPYLAPVDDLPYLIVESPTDIVFVQDWDPLLAREEASALTSDELRVRGNNCVSDKRYKEALMWYDLALRKSPSDSSVINANRSAVFLELGRFEEAFESAEISMRDGDSEINSTALLKIKAWNRLGQAAYHLCERRKAIESREAMRELDPDNTFGLECLKQARLRLRESKGNMRCVHCQDRPES
jgi:tetratricopeptide (TPR) repeat protein